MTTRSGTDGAGGPALLMPMRFEDGTGPRRVGPAALDGRDGHRAASTTVKEPIESQRTQWERVALSQNVELHIRRPLSRLEQKRIERLIRLGREILEEGDQP